MDFELIEDRSFNDSFDYEYQFVLAIFSDPSTSHKIVYKNYHGFDVTVETTYIDTLNDQ